MSNYKFAKIIIIVLDNIFIWQNLCLDVLKQPLLGRESLKCKETRLTNRVGKTTKKADVSLWRRLSNKRIHLTKISMVNQALQIHSM